jgi:hypothetical protein
MSQRRRRALVAVLIAGGLALLPAATLAQAGRPPVRTTPLGPTFEAHWERRTSEREYYVPPLVGRTQDGGAVNVPAGTRPPVEERQGP